MTFNTPDTANALSGMPVSPMLRKIAASKLYSNITAINTDVCTALRIASSSFFPIALAITTFAPNATPIYHSNFTAVTQPM